MRAGPYQTLPNEPACTQVEIEFTNYCNARCVACPRSDMPSYGFMTEQTLSTIVEVYRDYRNPLTGTRPRLIVAGGGEPLLHTRAAELLSLCRSSGLFVSLITNASRFHCVDLNRILSNVDQLLISFWGIREDEYTQSMHLDYKLALSNVDSALPLAHRAGVSVALQYLRTKHLVSSDEDIQKFWIDRGIEDVRGGNVMWNRGGRLSDIDESLRISEALLPDFSRRVWCADLYFSDAYSWDGALVLCCCSFFTSHSRPLGRIQNLDIEKISEIKAQVLKNRGQDSCVNCRLPRRFRPAQLAPDILDKLSPEEYHRLTYR
jgi:MoaA/NifB/PqqE/SkfB family radical SAM enzyme